MSFIFVWIIIAVVTFVLLRLGNRKMQIKDPRLGLLDLTDGRSTGLIQEDKIALRDMFSSWEDSTSTVPRCDVLFLYATIGDGDTLGGTDRNLREIIRDSGAKIVVVASENPNPKPAPGKPAYGHANLVITLARNGSSFPTFFQQLFAKMKAGTSMPMAWVKLAPQTPRGEHKDCPSTIFLCEVGGVTFS